jgi:hypothetical protein
MATHAGDNDAQAPGERAQAPAPGEGVKRRQLIVISAWMTTIALAIALGIVIGKFLIR